MWPGHETHQSVTDTDSAADSEPVEATTPSEDETVPERPTDEEVHAEKRSELDAQNDEHIARRTGTYEQYYTD